MISLALQQFRSRWQRSTAVFVAVALGVAFFTVALLAGGPLNHNLREGVGQQIIGSDLVVTSNTSMLRDDDLNLVLSVEGVQSADLAGFSYAEIQSRGISSFLLIGDVPAVPAVQDNLDLRDGTLPQQPGEVALADNRFDDARLEIGSEVEIYFWTTEESHTFTVVGVYESPSGLSSGRASAFISQDEFDELIPNPYIFAMRIQLSEDRALADIQASIQQRLGAGYTVREVNDYIDAEISEFAGSTVSLQAALGAFATIAMIASGIVIVNSFEISLAQRIREIGLLRSVGATNRQVRRLVLAEAAIVGVTGSMVGIALGVGLMELVGRILWANGGSTGLEISTATIVLPFVLGLLTTIAAAIGPARRAMNVRPLQAIRQSDAPELPGTQSRRRMIVAGIIGGAGVVIMVISILFALNGGAETGFPLLIGIFGGALTFFAALVSAQVILPWVAAGLGSIATRLFGVTGELAAGNLGQNPRRTASAAAALLMGVTLMTMMTVGASSVRSTIVGEIEDLQPIDLSVRIDPEDMTSVDTEREVERWDELAAVDASSAIRVHQIQVGDVGETIIIAVDPDEAKLVFRNNGMEALTSDSILVTSDYARSYGLLEGDTVHLGDTESGVSLRVHIAPTGINDPVISTDTLGALEGNVPVGGAWIRLHDDSSVGDVMDQIRFGLPASVNLQVHGGASERESILEIIDIMLLVVLGLLATAVVIAIVGIGNTLTLSVIERTRESGMLRAMGLKRGQIRNMLAIEGVALALVGALVGIVLGIVYGFAGAMTLFGDSLGVRLSVPWGQIALIGLVAILSGLLASVLPARRALAIKPVEALSDIG